MEKKVKLLNNLYLNYFGPRTYDTFGITRIMHDDIENKKGNFYEYIQHILFIKKYINYDISFGYNFLLKEKLHVFLNNFINWVILNKIQLSSNESKIIDCVCDPKLIIARTKISLFKVLINCKKNNCDILIVTC